MTGTSDRSDATPSRLLPLPRRFPLTARRLYVTLATITILLSILAAKAGGASAPKLTVPPVTAADHMFSVTFVAPWTTTGRMRYFAVWKTLGDGIDCSTISDGPIGRGARAGQTVKMWLRGLRSMGYRFCAGPSELTVFFQAAGTGSVVSKTATAKTMRIVAKLRFVVSPR